MAARARSWGVLGALRPRDAGAPDEPDEPVDHVYGRISVDDDDSDDDGGGPAARARPARVSAPAAASSGGAASLPPPPPREASSASGPLPRLPSLLSGAPGPHGGSGSAAAPCDLKTANSAASAGSFSKLATEARATSPVAAPAAGRADTSAAAAHGGGGGSGGEPAAESLTEEQRAYGEALAAEADADAARAARGGAGPSGRAGGGGSDSDSDHAREQRQLVIYALPMTRDKIAFLPVVNFCQAPPPERRPQGGGSGGGVLHFMRERIAKATEEAAEVWEGLKAAEDGTFKNRIYKLGQRMLDGVSAEERLMRSLPRKIDAVVIYHPTQLGSDALQAQMKTMSTNYGIKAVGKAAAATVLLPLAIGVDLIILPGPQVLTYYTSWQLWRNAKGASGAWGRAAFVTQNGGSADIRVDYVPDTRLDRAYEGTRSSRDGVLPEEEISALVTALKEPSLEEPLRELRRQRLRKTGRAAPDASGRYAPLADEDDGGGGSGSAAGGGGGADGGGGGTDGGGGGAGGGGAGGDRPARSGSGGWAAWRS